MYFEFLECEISNLAGEIPESLNKVYMTKDVALERLRSTTGQDFGYDVEKWSDWVAEHGEALLIRLSNKADAKRRAERAKRQKELQEPRKKEIEQDN